MNTITEWLCSFYLFALKLGVVMVRIALEAS